MYCALCEEWIPPVVNHWEIQNQTICDGCKKEWDELSHDEKQRFILCTNALHALQPD